MSIMLLPEMADPLLPKTAESPKMTFKNYQS